MNSLNSTPSSERVHIGFFGLRNAGKSSIVNRITGQHMSIVSDVAGTTTDPVSKAMELLPLGPVQILDTPGIDDEGSLGSMRVKRTRQILASTDIAVLVTDITSQPAPSEIELMEIFHEKKIPFVVAMNKSDLCSSGCEDNSDSIIKAAKSCGLSGAIAVSAAEGFGIEELKEMIAKLSAAPSHERRIVADIISPGDFAVLVIPIDESAPKGRLILPQQQTVRDILESGAAAVAVRDTELENALAGLAQKPSIVITDSQAFARAAEVTPEDIRLTSFSILFARYKGDLALTVKGASSIDALQDGDTVLISEGCTHHRQCNDIGSVKLPAMLKSHIGAHINVELSSGRDFPEDLSPYSLIIHCGGCMLSGREMKNRQQSAINQNIPITNYGIAMAHMQGILARSVSMFPEIAALLEKSNNNK